MFFIVWGSHAWNTMLSEGQFYCPDYGDYRGYKLIARYKWFTLYWIPAFKSSQWGQFVKCNTYQSTYNERILQMDPKGDHEKFGAAFAVAAKRVMFKLALADGEIDESEVDQIAQTFANITKHEIKHEDIEAELVAARDDTRTIPQYLAKVSGSLNDSGREIVLRSELGDADKIAERTQEYEDRFANPFVAAEKGFVDDVILPHKTRVRLCRAFAMLRGKSLENPWKKHDNLPL